MPQKYKIETEAGNYDAWTSENINNGYCTSLVFSEDNVTKKLSAPGMNNQRTYRIEHFPGVSCDESHSNLVSWFKQKIGQDSKVTITAVK